MTAKRSDVEVFGLPCDKMAGLVRQVIAEHSEYRNPHSPSERVYHVTVKPSLFFLPTRMAIELVPRERETLVRVRAVSQPWVIGDIFGSYHRFIQDLLSRLREKVLICDNTDPALPATPRGTRGG